jgi:hypothetical protein
MPTTVFSLKPNAALHLHRGAVQRSFYPTPTALPGVRCKRLLDLRLPLPLWFGFAFGKRSCRAYDGAWDARGFLPPDGVHADDYLLS